jgi:2-polyprenyl-3-methyl-5-hydroxy-6-metoxy-1,4-benzoquinol methylase
MDSQQLGFNNAVFDFVCSFEVIEHVRDPERYLSEIWRVLKPAGLALLSTPNRLVSC